MKTIVGGNDVVPGCGPRTSAEEALEVTEAAWHSTAQLAYDLWELRGRPLGSPEVDRFAAFGVVYAGADGQESKGDARKQIHPITIGGLDEWQLLFSTR